MPKVTPYETLVISRTSLPNRPYLEMGTIAVACPSQGQVGMFGSIDVEGGCPYDQAVELAARKAALVGADGIYGITTTSAANGMVGSLIASAFKFQSPSQPLGQELVGPGKPLAQPSVSPVPAPAAPPTMPSVEERLRQVKDLRDKGLISPEDYEKRKAEILKQI